MGKHVEAPIPNLDHDAMEARLSEIFRKLVEARDSAQQGIELVSKLKFDLTRVEIANTERKLAEAVSVREELDRR